MKLLSILLISTIILSCGNSKSLNSETTETIEKQGPSAKKAILSQDIGKFRNTEPYSILDIELNANILQLNITYNGGCTDHEFELVGSSFITKSMPPKRLIQLYHHKSNDDCRELVHETLYFDISVFAHSNGEIVLQLQHFKEAFRYSIVVED